MRGTHEFTAFGRSAADELLPRVGALGGSIGSILPDGKVLGGQQPQDYDGGIAR
eukprot:CAMPEP_0171273626 /NCGR_PEP_ID=MMETSP0790-20130122/62388_1 /TAXON_ID=2925 /ORGANISM="Alexandrium catenella, Strain OF101" /LENGTH=53 /DNA_ID=CAMNT_0011742633 /DNA_START=100 /DNA_END=258 /DNA_ORIENTATION=-